jgi:hypothetical protein
MTHNDLESTRRAAVIAVRIAGVAFVLLAVYFPPVIRWDQARLAATAAVAMGAVLLAVGMWRWAPRIIRPVPASYAVAAEDVRRVARTACVLIVGHAAALVALIETCAVGADHFFVAAEHQVDLTPRVAGALLAGTCASIMIIGAARIGGWPRLSPVPR